MSLSTTTTTITTTATTTTTTTTTTILQLLPPLILLPTTGSLTYDVDDGSYNSFVQKYTNNNYNTLYIRATEYFTNECHLQIKERLNVGEIVAERVAAAFFANVVWIQAAFVVRGRLELVTVVIG